MNMFKELNLVARVIYTVILALFFSGISGFSFYSCLVAVGPVIFLMSFAFQYAALYFILKKIAKTPRVRLYILLGWFVVSVTGILFAASMTPSLEEVSQYESAEAFLHIVAFWGGIFAAFGSALVALTCTRRAFARYRSLG